MVLSLGGNDALENADLLGPLAVGTSALALFNDVILRAAIERRLDVLDLRSVCRVPEDFANDIEPSDLGGQKIARAIAGSLGLVEGTVATRLLSL